MISVNEIADFVKGQARIVNTAEDTHLLAQINFALTGYCRRRFWPQLRTEATITTTSAQTYSLPFTSTASFDKIYEESVRYDTGGSSPYFLQCVKGNEAELWANMASQPDPLAFQIIAGATGNTRKIKLLPTFTNTGKTISYVYQYVPVLTALSGALAVPELCEAIAFKVLSLNKDYCRDGDSAQQDYMNLARRAYLDAINN